MLFYFLIFCLVGFGIGWVIRDKRIALGVIIVISVLWMFPFGKWALATFVELLVGYVIAICVRK